MSPAQRRIATAAYLEHTRNFRAIAAARVACIPHAADRIAQAEQRPSSMCMGIGSWTCADCPGGQCSHECHKEAVA